MVLLADTSDVLAELGGLLGEDTGEDRHGNGHKATDDVWTVRGVSLSPAEALALEQLQPGSRSLLELEVGGKSGEDVLALLAGPAPHGRCLLADAKAGAGIGVRDEVEEAV